MLDNSNLEAPSGEQFSAALSAYVQNFGTIPPKEAYHWHPAFRPLYEALIKRRCVLGRHWAAGTAINLLLSTFQSDGVLMIEGFSSAKEARDDVQERVRIIRTDPDERRLRGMMWRYWQREKLLIADLLDSNAPACKATREARKRILLTYVPDIKDMGGKIDWFY